MCTGVELTAIAALAGVGTSVAGIYQQGQTQEKIADYNVDLAKVKTADALSAGAIAEDRQRARARQIEGAQIASMGSSGAVVGEGSFGSILDQTVVYGELDSQTVRANALKQAWGLNTQAQADNLQGAMASLQGKYSAASTLLSSAPSVYKSGQAASWWK
jgi:hypothetical protein